MEAVNKVIQSDQGAQCPPNGNLISPPSDGVLDRACIIHLKSGINLTKKKTQNVLPFNATSWAKIQESVNRRRQRPNFHASVTQNQTQDLPENSTERDGYHPSCYKNFTAVPVTSDANNNKDCGNKFMLKVDLRSAAAVTNTSSGIITRKCLFCEKDRKRLKNGQVEFTGNCETLQAVQTIHEAAEVFKDNVFSQKCVVVLT